MKIGFIVASQERCFNDREETVSLIAPPRPMPYTFKDQSDAELYRSSLDLIDPHHYHQIFELHTAEKTL